MGYQLEAQISFLKSPSCLGPSHLPSLWLSEIDQHQGPVRSCVVERPSDLECCLLMTVNRSVLWSLPGIRDFLLTHQEGLNVTVGFGFGDAGKWVLQSVAAL